MKTTTRRRRKEGRGPALNIRVSDETIERLKLAATSDKRTPSGWARIAIEEALDRREREEREHG